MWKTLLTNGNKWLLFVVSLLSKLGETRLPLRPDAYGWGNSRLTHTAMLPNQLLQLAAAAWKGPALCPFAGIWVSQSAATYDKGGSRWYVSLKLAQQPAEGQARPEFSGSHPCAFEALREAFRALRAVAPGYAFAAVWAVIKAEDEYAGIPAHA